MSIFEDTISIVREAEHLVIGTRFKARWRHVESALDTIVHAPWFVLVGVQERLATFVFALFLIPVWWCFIAALMWATDGGSAVNLHTSQGWVVAGLMATGSILFCLPSRSTRLGIHPPQIAALAAHIKSIAPDEATIKLLQAGARRWMPLLRSLLHASNGSWGCIGQGLPGLHRIGYSRPESPT